MITLNNNNSQMHNDIMETSSKDRPPMLVAGRYAQWQSQVTVLAQPATENTPAIPAYKVPKTFKNITPENHAHFDVEAEEIHMILSGIGDDIYSIVVHCTSQEMRFVTVVKQTKDLDKESYHKLFDILKQYQNEVNEIRAEKRTKTMIQNKLRDDKDMQKNLALIAKYIDNIYKPTNNNLRTSSNTRNKNVDTSTRHKNDNQSGQFRNQRTVTVAGVGNFWIGVHQTGFTHGSTAHPAPQVPAPTADTRHETLLLASKY
ncbi:hypothetical protein Tco_0687049 [Tanacetum coccineum]